MTELLLELNPDVSGDFRQADPVYVIAHEPKYFEQFSMVVATQLDPESAQLLSILCERLQKPLWIVGLSETRTSKRRFASLESL